MIEFMNGGGFLSLMDDEAYKFLENLSESSQQWDFSICPCNMIESMNGGGFFGLMDDEAYTFLDNLSKSSQQWDFSFCPCN